MSELRTGINLFGMMNCGKTTVGKLIAAQYDLPFVDTDALITEQYGEVPGDIIKAEGADRFMVVQNEIIRAHPRSAVEVWATGGAVARDAELVEHLGSFGVNLFLLVEVGVLEARTSDEDIAKLANPKGLSYRELYEERMAFYIAASDAVVTVDSAQEVPEATAARVAALIPDVK